MHKTTSILLVAISFLAGCTSPRQMTLFTGANSVKIAPMPSYVIEPGDLLKITFSATNAETVVLYNSAGNDFLVRADGTITVPVLGRIAVAGKTAAEAIELLTNLMVKQVREPIVLVEFTNATVSVLGEVNHPAELSVPYPITLTEALGQVGGFTTNARCKDVLVLRNTNGSVVKYHINLLTDDLFASPCYYLQKGDVVYVAPLHTK
ncbi:MAG: polysaccharide biosynthesis/export family protein [Paludibacteraceae bacterium]|nr:polysaccharide biosynthesis/export family protein [Paludibacteraceae bacterium]